MLQHFTKFFFQFVGDSSLDRVFALLSRDNYSWDELQQRPLPDGVDPSRLEKYLNDDDFVVRNFLAIFLKSVYNKLCFKKFLLITEIFGTKPRRFQCSSTLETIRNSQRKRTFLKKEERKPTRNFAYYYIKNLHIICCDA